MKEDFTEEELQQGKEEIEKQANQGQNAFEKAVANLNSRDFAEKRGDINGYVKENYFREFLSSITDSNIGGNKEDKMDLFFASKEYEAFESQVLGTGMLGNNFTNPAVMNPLKELCDHVAQSNSYMDSQTKKLMSTALKSINTFCKENGINLKGENRSPERQYADALQSFNSKRASVFKKESEEHKLLRESSEKLQTFRNNQKEPKEALRGMSQEERVQFAKEWLRNAHEMRDAARDYISAKSGASTPAGKERLKGAKRLKAIGKAEIDACRSALLEVGGEELLRETYAAIREDMVADARKTLEGMKDITKRNLDEKQSQAVYNSVHTLLASAACRTADSKNVPSQDSNIFRVMRHNKNNPEINEAVGKYVYLTAPSDVYKNAKKIRGDRPEQGIVEGVREYVRHDPEKKIQALGSKGYSLNINTAKNKTQEQKAESESKKLQGFKR